MSEWIPSTLTEAGIVLLIFAVFVMPLGRVARERFGKRPATADRRPRGFVLPGAGGSPAGGRNTVRWQSDEMTDEQAAAFLRRVGPRPSGAAGYGGGDQRVVQRPPAPRRRMSPEEELEELEELEEWRAYRRQQQGRRA